MFTVYFYVKISDIFTKLHTYITFNYIFSKKSVRKHERAIMWFVAREKPLELNCLGIPMSVCPDI